MTGPSVSQRTLNHLPRLIDIGIPSIPDFSNTEISSSSCPFARFPHPEQNIFMKHVSRNMELPPNSRPLGIHTIYRTIFGGSLLLDLLYQLPTIP